MSSTQWAVQVLLQNVLSLAQAMLVSPDRSHTSLLGSCPEGPQYFVFEAQFTLDKNRDCAINAGLFANQFPY